MGLWTHHSGTAWTETWTDHEYRPLHDPATSRPRQHRATALGVVSRDRLRRERLADRRERRIKRTVQTYAEAKLALTDLQKQVDTNQHPKSAIILAEAIEQWLQVAKLEETTRDRYEDLIRLYITPRLGHLQAGRLDAELLERFYARLHRCRDLCGNRPPGRWAGSRRRPIAGPSQ